MVHFSHSKITTLDHLMVGTIWPFRGCQVVMQPEGFTCTCQKRPKMKCNHIKSVELGILGVGQTYQK